MKYSIFSFLIMAALCVGCDQGGGGELEDRVDRLEREVESMNANKLINSNPNTASTPTGIDESLPVSQIKFEETAHDFGTIKSGEKVTTIFKFTNTGSAPLVIQNATASCGCTVPEKPEAPILPGEMGELKVEYDSRGKSGMQNKQVTVTANTQPSITTLQIIANVELDEAAQDQ